MAEGSMSDTKEKILFETNQLVISLNTQVAVLTNALNENTKRVDKFIEKVDEQHERMDTRVTLQRNDIVKLETRLDNLHSDVRELKSRSNVWDILNSLGILISAYIGYVFGNR